LSIQDGLNVDQAQSSQDIACTNQLLYKGIFRLRNDLKGSAILDQTTFLHDHDLIRQPECLLDVMSDE